MERGCWAVLLQELSQVQRQEGLQRGRAEGTDPETLGRAEGQAQSLPSRRPSSARPAAHLCIFCSAQQGSPSAGAIGVSPYPRFWFIWLVLLSVGGLARPSLHDQGPRRPSTQRRGPGPSGAGGEIST